MFPIQSRILKIHLMAKVKNIACLGSNTWNCTTQLLEELSFGDGVCPNLQRLLVNSCNHLLGHGTLPNAFVEQKLIDWHQLSNIEGLCSLTKLQELEIKDCIAMEELSGFDTLASLEFLQAHKCVKLKSIQGSTKLINL